MSCRAPAQQLVSAAGIPVMPGLTRHPAALNTEAQGVKSRWIPRPPKDALGTSGTLKKSVMSAVRTACRVGARNDDY